MSTSNNVQLYDSDTDEEELDSRQLEVLGALSECESATYSFQGLRRRLGFHQEMLSRTLDRLEDQHLVVKTNDGYRINPEATFHLGYDFEITPIETQVVEATLPAEIEVSFLLKTLRGRWFRELRWLGYSEAHSGLTLSWITEDGRIQLRVKMLKSKLAISTLCRSEKDRERAIKSAFELFDFVTRVAGKSQIPLRDQVPN
jgi:hypothetical protein